MMRLKSKITIRIGQGDILAVRTPGGGGYGDPFDREPELVLQDALDGKVSLEAACSEYGVVIDRETMRLNREATLELRKGRSK